MFVFFYNLALHLAWPFYWLLSFVHPKLYRFYRTRSQGLRDLRRYARHVRQAPIWLHASSAGELDQALAVLRELRTRHPGRPTILSVFSLSVDLRDIPGVDLMFYLPLDFSWNWMFLPRRFRPVAFVTMTWDVFPNLLRSLSRRRVPTFLCSAALEPDSWRVRGMGRRALAGVYRRLTGIGTVNEDNRETFLKLLPDPQRVQVTGDARYDMILYRIARQDSGSDDQRILDRIRRIRGPVWILASTYEADDREIFSHLPDLLEQYPRWKLLIFPHKIDEERLREVEDGLAETGLVCRRFSRLADLNSERIVLVDRMGVLALAYRHGNFAYVGGAFHHRVHNTAEPAALGRAVLTGPRIDASPIALELEQTGSLKRCDEGEQVISYASYWMEREKEAVKLGNAARSHLRAQAGGAARFYETFLARVLVTGSGES